MNVNYSSLKWYRMTCSKGCDIRIGLEPDCSILGCICGNTDFKIVDDPKVFDELVKDNSVKVN